MSASPQPAIANQPVTLTATLSPLTVNGYTTDGGRNLQHERPDLCRDSVRWRCWVSITNLASGQYTATVSYGSDANFQLSTSSPINVEVMAAGAGNPGLKGAYIFHFTGTLPAQDGPVQGFAGVGWFQADGAGNIIGGEEDANSAIGLVTVSALQGTYSV